MTGKEKSMDKRMSRYTSELQKFLGESPEEKESDESEDADNDISIYALREEGDKRMPVGADKRE